MSAKKELRHAWIVFKVNEKAETVAFAGDNGMVCVACASFGFALDGGTLWLFGSDGVMEIEEENAANVESYSDVDSCFACNEKIIDESTYDSYAEKE